MSVSYLDQLLEKRQSENNPKTPSEENVWWTPAVLDDDENEEWVQKQRAGSLVSCAQALETVQREIHEQNLWSCQLYSNRELSAFDWGTNQLTRASLAPVTRSGENITVRVVESLVSQIGKNRPKPKPVPRGASFHLRQSIKKLDKYLYGEFQRNSVYALTKQCFRDACIFGFGCMGVTVEDDEDHGAQVEYERVFPDEILVDQMEIVAFGKIRHFYRRRVLPVEVVAETYGISVDKLREEGNEGYQYLDYRPTGAGWVVVIEGYQLAYGKKSGRWMVATNNTVLDEGEWNHKWIPYLFYHWQTPVNGFYSPSVVEQVLPYQIRLNEINEVIRDAQDLMARPRIFVEEGSRVNPMEIDDIIGRFIKYTGKMPEAITWQAISAELYNERDRLVRVCLEHFGISQMAASATPPPSARFDSSAAFREFNAIQDDRLSDPAQRFEDFHLTLASRTVEVVAASGKNPKTTWYSGWRMSRAEEIEWKQINTEMNSYVMTMEAVSIYSMSPSSGRDELEKQLGMGLITPEQYRAELSSMDMEGMYSLQAAADEDLQRVQDLLESGEFEIPTKEQDLVNGITRMTLALLQLNKYKDTPKQVKLNFVNWITYAQAIIEQGTEPMEEFESPSSLQGAGGMAGPSTVPVPEAMGLAPAGPGPMPNV
jgi:hypothetical protein